MKQSEQAGPAGDGVDLDFPGLEAKLKELLDSTLYDFLVQGDIDELRHAVKEVVISSISTPASSPRDLEVDGKPAIVAKAWRANGCPECGRSISHTATCSHAHPPKGETHSEAAGAEDAAAILKQAREKFAAWESDEISDSNLLGRLGEIIAGWPEAPAEEVKDKTQEGAAKVLLGILSRYGGGPSWDSPKWEDYARDSQDILMGYVADIVRAAPKAGTPIEKAAREYVEAARRYMDAQPGRRTAEEDARHTAWLALSDAVDGSGLPQEPRPCGTCGGTRKVDSGGQDGAGNWIERDCPECAPAPHVPRGYMEEANCRECGRPMRDPVHIGLFGSQPPAPTSPA